jgi:hypothetical protein
MLIIAKRQHLVDAPLKPKYTTSEQNLLHLTANTNWFTYAWTMQQSLLRELREAQTPSAMIPKPQKQTHLSLEKLLVKPVMNHQVHINR